MITAMPRIAIAMHDFDGAVRLFRDVLGMPVADISARSSASLGARLAICVPAGGSNIELMAPADPRAPLAQSLAKFLDRRGQGLFALMLEAPDPDAEATVLAARGLGVLPLMPGAAGRDVHPKSTCGVLIRVYPVDSFVPEADQVRISEGGALGLSGIMRVIIAVEDIGRAAAIYGAQFGIATQPPVEDEVRGVHCAVSLPPAGGSIELTAVVSEGRQYGAAIAAHLSEFGEGMFAIVLQAADPWAVAETLRGRGIRCERFVDQEIVAVDRAQTFGARILVEPARLRR